MKKIISLVCCFAILFAVIYYESQTSVKVGKVYEVPLQTSDSLFSDMDVDEERIESKANEILKKIFGDQFNQSDYKVSIDTVKGINNTPCYSVYFFNEKTQMEGYSIEFDIESGDIVYIWNNEFEYQEPIWGKELMSDEKLEEAAENYFKKISLDEVDDYQLVQKIYLMAGVQFIYKDDKRSQKVTILLVPETGEFMNYLREADL